MGKRPLIASSVTETWITVDVPILLDLLILLLIALVLDLQPLARLI